MGIGSKFEEQWEGYCKMCEWFMVCSETQVCPYFTPQDLIDFEVSEIICDQNMRQAEYLKIVAEFGGDC